MNTTAIVAAIVSVGSMISIATGHPALGALISDPSTANEMQAVIGGISALVSAFSAPVHELVKPTLPPNKPKA